MRQKMLGRRVMQGEITHFLHQVISQQSVVLPQISHWPRQFPACPAQKKMVQGNYLCTRTYDIGASFELIFMKFACLIQIHLWVKTIVFGNNRPSRTTDMGKNVSPKPVFWLSFRRYGIFHGKNL